MATDKGILIMVEIILVNNVVQVHCVDNIITLELKYSWSINTLAPIVVGLNSKYQYKYINNRLWFQVKILYK